MKMIPLGLLQAQAGRMRVSKVALRRSIFGIYLLLYPLPWIAHGASWIGFIAFMAGALLSLALPLLPGRLAAPLELRVIIYALIGVFLIPFHGYWGVFFISAAASCGAIRKKMTRHLLLGSVLTGCAGLTWIMHEGLISCLITLIVAVGSFSTVKLSMDLQRQNEALSIAQAEIRTLTLIAERERFARDLHDTLGQSLTLIALKSELALLHLISKPEIAATELRDIAKKARDALGETRLVVSGMHITSLEEELTSGVAALDAAGIVTKISGDHHDMPAHAEAVLALILREALTNILRHAQATSCTITFDRSPKDEAQLIISDYQTDPLRHESPLSFREGNGISGIRRRLIEINGTLSIRQRPDGTTLLITLGGAI